MRYVHSAFLYAALIGILGSAAAEGVGSSPPVPLADAIRHELILSDDVCEAFVWYTSETSGLICTPWTVSASEARSASEWNERVYGSLYEEGSPRATRSQGGAGLVDVLYVTFDDQISTDACDRTLGEHFRQKAYCACNPETGACCGGQAGGVVLDVPLVSRIQDAQTLLYAAWQRVAVFVPSTDCVPQGEGLLSRLREQFERAAWLDANHIDTIHYSNQGDLEADRGDRTDVAILLAQVSAHHGASPLILDICGELLAAGDVVDLLAAQRVILLAVGGDDTLIGSVASIFELHSRYDRLLALPLVQELAMDLPAMLFALQTGTLSSLQWPDITRRLSLVSFFVAGGDGNP